MGPSFGQSAELGSVRAGGRLALEEYTWCRAAMKGTVREQGTWKEGSSARDHRPWQAVLTIQGSISKREFDGRRSSWLSPGNHE